MLSLIIFALCIFAFATCLLAALVILLLQVFTDWKPRNKSLSDWLLKSVLFAAVSAVVGFAVYSFNQGDIDGALDRPTNDQEAASSSSSEPAPTADPGPGGAPPPGLSGDPLHDRVETEEGSSPELAGEPVGDLPDEVARWVAQNLPRRPSIPGDWQDRYPPCAASERSRQPPLAHRARQCLSGEMVHFNENILRPYQDQYDDYMESLEREAIRQDDGPVLEFLRNEHIGFTTRDFPAPRLYNEISNRWEQDGTALRRIAY